MIDLGDLFSDIVSRRKKPRSRGLTCVIDSGVGPRTFADILDAAGPYIDYVKFGWGTGLVTPCIDRKIEILRSNDIPFWFGGTLFEVSILRDKLDQYVAWLGKRNASHVEISDGSIAIDHDRKLEIIRELAKNFTVLSEVGNKDAEYIMSPARWVAQISSELEAGSWKVITEGRESGTAGVFRASGEVRMGLIQEIGDAGIDYNDLLFEAPQKDQQSWFIKNIGTDVNLANIVMTDAINLETLRLGLRGDTIEAVHSAP